MSRPFRLNTEQITAMLGAIKKDLESVPLLFGNEKIELPKLSSTKDRMSLVFSPIAFSKMLGLIQGFDSEVGWHGVCERDGNKIIVSDILVYPQEVTGSTVSTDEGDYALWMAETLEDYDNNPIRFHGHSHVNMGITPSGTDLAHREAILDKFDKDNPEHFYVFMIMNKKMSYSVQIFDNETNTIYDTSDVDIYVGDEYFNIAPFLTEAQELVVKAKYTAYYKSQKGKGKNASSDEDIARYSWYNRYGLDPDEY